MKGCLEHQNTPTESNCLQTNVRSNSRIHYNTFLPVIFGVKKYADELLKVVKRKDIKVNYKTVLNRIYPDKKEAVFVCTDDRSKVS